MKKLENREHKFTIELKFTFRQVMVGFVVLAMVGVPLELGSETIMLSTTYPSPVGIYHRLITTGTQGSPAGDTYLNRDGGNTLLAANNPFSYVGVGTGANPPQAKLDVNGAVRVGNFNGPANYPAPTPGGMIYDSSGGGSFLGASGSPSVWKALGGGLNYIGECGASGSTSCKCNAGESLMLPDWSNLQVWWVPVIPQVYSQGSTSVYGYCYSPDNQGTCHFACFK